jgi:hypothetical protein
VNFKEKTEKGEERKLSEKSNIRKFPTIQEYASRMQGFIEG